jgi:hypothetical protein
MCQTTGPKYFFPPNQIGSSGVAPPVNYASSPQATADASNPANLPKPPQPQPVPPVTGGASGNPATDPMSQIRRLFGGGGMFGGLPVMRGQMQG